MFLEFVEVLFGSSVDDKEGKNDVTKLGHGHLATTATTSEESGLDFESESEETTEESGAVEEEEVVNTEVRAHHPSSKQNLTDQFSEITLLTGSDSIDPMDVEVFSEDTSIQHVIKTSWREAKVDITEQIKKEEKKKKKTNQKTEECIRQLHKRDECLKMLCEQKMRKRMEQEKKKGRKQMQMIFEKHKQQQTQKVVRIAGHQQTRQDRTPKRALVTVVEHRRGEQDSDSSPKRRLQLQSMQLSRMMRSGNNRKGRGDGLKQKVGRSLSGKIMHGQ